MPISNCWSRMQFVKQADTKRGYMSFPVNLLGTEEIVAELKRRKSSEVEELRGKIAEHRSAIRELEARIELSSQKKKRGPKPKA